MTAGNTQKQRRIINMSSSIQLFELSPLEAGKTSGDASGVHQLHRLRSLGK